MNRIVVVCLLSITVQLLPSSVRFTRAGKAEADEGAARTAAAEPERIMLVRLKGRSAKDIAKTLESVFGDESDLQIISDTESNTLMLRGSEEILNRSIRLLQQLDAPPRMITLNVEISVVGDGDTGTQNKLLDELRLTTLEDNEALLQFGEQRAVQSGTQQIPGRPGSRSFRSVETGTLVRARPRVMGESIVVELQVEKSWLDVSAGEKDAESEEKGSDQPETFTTTLQTTLILKAGESQSITAKINGGTQQGREVLISISGTFDS